jgi:glycosyltransferase involved in cell wall biosynthesis
LSSSAPSLDPAAVLAVAEYGVLNGGERSFLAIAPRLIEMGWHLQVLVPTNSEFEQALQAHRIPTLPLTKHDSGGQRKSLDEIRQQLADHFKSVQPTLIHCNSISTSRWCGPVTRNLGIPAIGYLRDILRLSRQAIVDINHLDLLVAVSNATRDWHVNQGLEAAKVEVVNNGIDLDEFAPAENSQRDSIRAEFNLAAADPIVLFVGQIGMRKGIDLLIEAFRRIANEIPAAHLLIVGERNSTKDEAIEFETRVRRSANESTAAGHIHWLGRRGDVAEIMRQSDLLIHPARQEPLGRVLLEAAASGLPIVTTRVGGSPEILSSLDEFALVQPLDSESLAERAVELLCHRHEREAISKRLRQLAESRFSDSQCAAAVHQCYLRALDRRS